MPLLKVTKKAVLNCVFYICLMPLLFSCNTISSPEELVKAYVQAVKDEDSSALWELETDDNILWDSDSDWDSAFEIRYVFRPDGRNGRGKRMIKKNSQLTIQNVMKVNGVDTTEVAFDPTGKEEIDINSSNEWLVRVLIDKYEVLFAIEGDENHEYKIDLRKTIGFNIPDLDAIKKKLKLNCEVSLKGKTDADLAELYISLEDNIKQFLAFSHYVEKKDTTRIYTIYPALKKYKGSFRLDEKPVIKSYTASSKNKALIVCADSVEYTMDRNNKIGNSRGVISPLKLQNEIVELGGTPIDRELRMDREYMAALKNQKEDLEEELQRQKEEQERQIRAARYKSQGAALISSSFSYNREKDTKGVKFSVVNLSNRTIKYVILNIVGYNNVDDPIWDGGYFQNVRGIGPIEEGCIAEWDFDNIWTMNPSLVKNYEIKAMTIIFANGGTKTIKLPKELPSDWKDWLY